MGKSDLLKDSMKTGLDGLLSPTGKTPQPQRPAAPVAEKEPAVHCIFVIDRSIHTRMKYLSIEKEVSLKEIVNEAMKEYLAKTGNKGAPLISRFMPVTFPSSHSDSGGYNISSIDKPL